MAVKPPVVAGKYTLLRRLGQGGMAEVFLARQASEGGFEKLVVLKRILPHLASGSDFTAMFLDEARVAADLRHPNVVTIVDVGRSGESLFMVMEFLHGQDVRKVQRKVATFGQMIPFGHASQIAIDAAAGLHYAHTKKDLNGRALQIVHRDVSPQNILVTFEGGTKIVDFGIAKAVGQSTHTLAGVLKGKYTYMSPEQAQGEIVDARTDQFALGIVFWELLTMRRLFKRETESQTLDAIVEGNIPRPRRFRDDVPSSIEDVVMTALARDKHKRFRDCEEMALALEDALAKESIVHSPSRLSQYMRRLFADQIAEEASLGVVAPDGSISVRNTFPLHERRPDPDAARVESKRPSIADADVAPPRQDAAAPDDDGAPVDQTHADRRRGRSRSAEAEREPSPKKDRVTKASAEITKEPTKDAVREPTKAPTKSAAAEPVKDALKEREPTRSRSPADIAPSATASAPRRAPVLLVGGAVAAVVCVVVVVALLAIGDGPANLIVRTEPRGARVVVDGRDTQQASPALLRDVRSGEPHKVHVELPGYLPLDEIVTIPRKGITHEVRFDLTPVR